MSSSLSADAVIIGGGLIGLACAVAVARDGATAIVLDDSRPGAASPAAAGMLAPSIDRSPGPANDFATAARDRYPTFVDWLKGHTGPPVALNTEGILQVALSEAGVRGLQRAMARDGNGVARWLDAVSLRDLEPPLSHALGAVLHPLDGAVDTVALLSALRNFCRRATGVTTVAATAAVITSMDPVVCVRASDGTLYQGRYIVVASGAWAPAVGGLPRRLPISPLRGQMLSFDGNPLRHVVFGPRGYVIPRAGSAAEAGRPAQTLVGATSERVDFDPGTTPAAAHRLHVAGADILPSLATATPGRHWSGLRPVTPDLLPIIGPDPDHPSVLYACGHSRNGILMAPLTGDCISALVRGVASPSDLRPFSIERFSPA